MNCVNALSRAQSISTATERKGEIYVGGVNALSRAQSISTGSRENYKVPEDCVNALSRAQSISTILQAHIQSIFLKCQCPKSGSIHFYLNQNEV